MSQPKSSMFVLANGRNVFFTFLLVSSLFLLWGFCNGMIDVMDKHFQEELKLSLSQSAWVQFAHYLGYFLMSLPAGWLATRLGYKGGIIAGLLMVAVGGFWFIPATKIAAFWAFLTGVCVIASGLTFLETVANPYTTVLGAPRFAATRINIAQSCNGVGWIFGPIAGSAFFYGTDAAGRSTGAQTLWIPYAGVAVVVLILAVVFFFAPIPDVKTDEPQAADAKTDADVGAVANRRINRKSVYVLLLLNVGVLIGIFGMILWLILEAVGAGQPALTLAGWLPRLPGMTLNPDSALLLVLFWAGAIGLVLAAIKLAVTVKKISAQSIWAHEHFTGATLAQFVYVAAQAGIFSFLINYLVSEPPALPNSWLTERTQNWFEVKTAFSANDFKDLPSLAHRLSDKSDALSAFLTANLSPATTEALNEFQSGTTGAAALRVALTQDLNSLVLKEQLYTPERFAGVTLSDPTRELLVSASESRRSARLNRLLLAEAYPEVLTFHDGFLVITNQLAAQLVSFGFICFLIGRITGALLLKKFSAHKVVGLYGALNVIACLLIFLKLGWLSVVCVFLTYFFMSIMFPTIFALGIFGLGSKAKGAAAYIVMGIMGGAILPKLMGAVADHYDMSRAFIVPLLCFALITLYGYTWPKLSQAEALHGVRRVGGH
ncbi:MAG: MFS transporter [Verrucomicrobiae bacterium]|nr:MFS transporter [Verrucomicrobiae bacterium]